MFELYIILGTAVLLIIIVVIIVVITNKSNPPPKNKYAPSKHPKSYNEMIMSSKSPQPSMPPTLA